MTDRHNLDELGNALFALVRLLNPAFISPLLSVYIASDGSIGESVRPVRSQCRTWAIMTTWTNTSDIARRRLIREGRTPPAGEAMTGRLIVAVASSCLLSTGFIAMLVSVTIPVDVTDDYTTFIGMTATSILTL